MRKTNAPNIKRENIIILYLKEEKFLANILNNNFHNRSDNHNKNA
jgi:hypothetical protein